MRITSKILFYRGSGTANRPVLFTAHDRETARGYEKAAGIGGLIIISILASAAFEVRQ